MIKICRDKNNGDAYPGSPLAYSVFSGALHKDSLHNTLFITQPILGDPGAASWGDGIFTGKSLQQERESPCSFTLTERVPETFEILLTDWPEKLSGQSEDGISNASGTRSVRVNAQGLSCSCSKRLAVKILSPQLQSWTKLVETNAISERISPFLCMEMPTTLQKCFSSPPSPPSMLFGGTEESSGGFWWQSNIDKGERGEDLLW